MANNLYDITNVDSLLQMVPYEDNVLQYYDNVTYNIRFYMLNHTYQKKLSIDRALGIIPNNYRLPDDSKIIIAETGVSSNYNIQSLSIDAVHTSISQNPSATTYKMELKIDEVNGCSLANRIVAVSKLVGYESYILQPFHIDVWFSGYEQSTDKAVKTIGNQVLTYEVLLSEIKTNIDNNGTSYNFIMAPVPQSTFSKTINSIGNIGNLDIKSGTMKEYKEKIEEYLNKRYFENHPHLKSLYSDEKFIVIDSLIEDDFSIERQIINTYNEREGVKKIGFNIEDVMVYNNNTPQNTDSSTGGMVRPSVDDTFDEFFQKLCFQTERLKDYIARPVYRTEYLGNISGQEVQRIHIDIVFRKNSYLTYFHEKADDKSADNKKELDRINKMQVKELQGLIQNKTLVKRYEWMFNGRDTSVLEFNTSIDKLWYANIPLMDALYISENSNDNVKKANDREMLISKNMEMIRQDTVYKEKLDRVISLSNAPLSGIRNLAGDKRLYLDDIYNCIDAKTKRDLLNNRKILEKYDEFSVIDYFDTSSTEVTSNNAKVGYNNIYKSGNLVELKLRVLGDPYWLEQCSDNVLYKPNNAKNTSAFHNFSFRVCTPLEQKEDGTYDPENAMDFSSIYQLVETTSLFEGGKFTQQLKGVINQAFMHSARLKV